MLDVRIISVLVLIGSITGVLVANNAPGTADEGGYASKKHEIEHQIREIRVVELPDAATPEDAGVKIPAPELAASPEPKHFYEDELVDVLRAAGFEGDAVQHAWAVAMKESTGNPNAHNQNSNTGDNSYGLFQINMIGGLGPARLEKFSLDSYEDLFDPYINASVAFEMSDGGADWGPWGIGPNAYTGGTKGSYYKWLDEFRRLTNG